MRPFQIAAILLFFLCFSAADAAPLGLSIVRGAGTVVTGSASALWMFTASSSSDTPLTHTFFLHNGTKRTVTIERVAVSCDCVQAQVGETQLLPVKVAPGQTVPVQLSLSMGRLVPGSVSKSAWIYPHGSGDACLRLEMHGTVRDDSASAKSSAASASVSASR